MTCYVVWDGQNRPVETFAGPHRLAMWDALPAGWSIEEFSGNVSRGAVSLEYVRRHAQQDDEPEYRADQRRAAENGWGA